MTSEQTLTVTRSVPVSMLFNMIKSHVIIYDPPYDISRILRDYQKLTGMTITVVIRHREREVSIISLAERIRQSSISELVLSTAVTAFQRHRLDQRHVVDFSQHVLQRPAFRPPATLSQGHVARGQDFREDSRLSTGKNCSVCMEVICQNDLRVLPCAHVFHASCIGRWFREQRTCPECRSSA